MMNSVDLETLTLGELNTLTSDIEEEKKRRLALEQVITYLNTRKNLHIEIDHDTRKVMFLANSPLLDMLDREWIGDTSDTRNSIKMITFNTYIGSDPVGGEVVGLDNLVTTGDGKIVLLGTSLLNRCFTFFKEAGIAKVKLTPPHAIFQGHEHDLRKY